MPCAGRVCLAAAVVVGIHSHYEVGVVGKGNATLPWVAVRVVAAVAQEGTLSAPGAWCKADRMGAGVGGGAQRAGSGGARGKAGVLRAALRGRAQYPVWVWGVAF